MSDVRAKQEVEGTAAEGSAVTGNPMVIGLDDGTNVIRAQANAAGDLKVTLDNEAIFDPGTIDGFGHLITGEYVNQIDLQFFRDTPANLTTVSTAGGGATSQVGGSGKWETSTAATANAKSVSTQSTSYRSGSDIFALFTAAFTTGVANSFQRIGLYDTNDGFFFGYEGTSFGVTIRNATSDTTTAKASFSEDTLTGAAGSLFTRDGTPEAIDPTKLNVYRIRFGWLGSGTIHFEILSPDDHWVSFHKILQPNLAAIASIENPDLPMTLHVDKNGADATNIIMISSCWGAGISTGALPLDEVLTDKVLAKINRNVIVGKTAGGTYVNVQTTTAGNLKIALDEYDGVPTGGGVESGALRVTLANDGTGVLTVDNAGTFLVQADSVIPGVGATNLGKAEDVAHSDGDVGVMMLAVRGDSLASLVDTDGDYAPLQVSASGNLKTAIEEFAVSLPAGSNNIGDVDVLSVVPGVGAVDLGKAEGAAHTDGDTGVMSLAVRNDDLADLSGSDGNYGPLQVSQNGALLVAPGANDDYKYAIIDAAGSGDNTIVGLVSSRKLRVLSLFMISAGTVLARFESNAGGTALTGQMSLIANSGFSLGFNPAGWFETTAGQLLNLELSAAISVDGSITYIEVP